MTLLSQVRNTNGDVVRAAERVRHFNDAVAGLKAVAGFHDDIVQLFGTDHLMSAVRQKHNDIAVLYSAGAHVDLRIIKTECGCEQIPVGVLKDLLLGDFPVVT